MSFTCTSIRCWFARYAGRCSNNDNDNNNFLEKTFPQTIYTYMQTCDHHFHKRKRLGLGHNFWALAFWLNQKADTRIFCRWTLPSVTEWPMCDLYLILDGVTFSLKVEYGKVVMSSQSAIRMRSSFDHARFCTLVELKNWCICEGNLWKIGTCFSKTCFWLLNSQKMVQGIQIRNTSIIRSSSLS